MMLTHRITAWQAIYSTSGEVLLPWGLAAFDDGSSGRHFYAAVFYKKLKSSWKSSYPAVKQRIPYITYHRLAPWSCISQECKLEGYELVVTSIWCAPFRELNTTCSFGLIPDLDSDPTIWTRNRIQTRMRMMF